MASFETVLEIAQIRVDRSLEASTLNKLGNVFESLGDYSRSLQYVAQSIAIAQDIGDLDQEATALNTQGHLCYWLTNYPEGLVAHNRAMTLAEEIPNPALIGSAAGGLSNIYQALSEYEQAVHYH